MSKIAFEKVYEEKIDEEEVDEEKGDEEKIDEKEVDEEKLDEEKLDEEKLDEEEEKAYEEKAYEEKVDEEKVDEEKVDEEKVDEEKVDEEKVDEEKVDEEKVDEEKVDKTIDDDVSIASSGDGDAHHDKDLDATAANLLRENAYNYIKEERETYLFIYDIITNYVIKNKLFISDLYTLTGQLDNIQRYDDYHFDIYCSNPLEHSNNLINDIYTKLTTTKNNLDHLVDTLTMNTVVENEEFNIAFDMRFLVKIYALQRNRKSNSSIDVAKIIRPMVKDNINYLPVDLEIIEMYHNIYTTFSQSQLELQMYKKWLVENTSYDTPEKNISKQKPVNKHIEGSAEGSAEGSCYERKKDELEAIKIAILKDFFKNRDDIALLGPLAIDWLTYGHDICPKYERIQIMSTRPAEQIRDQLNKYLETLGRGYKINISDELDLILPRDFRTKRIIFSMPIGSKEKPFLEYFNSSSFELIPVMIVKGLVIANRDVLLRFLFIDIWITKFIHAIGKLDDQSLQKKLERSKELLSVVFDKPRVINGVLGRYSDADIEKRMLLLKQNKKHWAYIPNEYIKQNKKLRKINHYG